MRLAAKLIKLNNLNLNLWIFSVADVPAPMRLVAKRWTSQAGEANRLVRILYYKCPGPSAHDNIKDTIPNTVTEFQRQKRMREWYMSLQVGTPPSRAVSPPPLPSRRSPSPPCRTTTPPTTPPRTCRPSWTLSGRRTSTISTENLLEMGSLSADCSEETTLPQQR